VELQARWRCLWQRIPQPEAGILIAVGVEAAALVGDGQLRGAAEVFDVAIEKDKVLALPGAAGEMAIAGVEGLAEFEFRLAKRQAGIGKG